MSAKIIDENDFPMNTNPSVPVATPKAREWWVFSTCLTTGELMLLDDSTGDFGVVEHPTKEEWSAAFDAPEHPYQWTDNSRVVIKKERALQ